MRIFHKFSSTHTDVVCGLAYNAFGTRLATCSTDQSLKVWDFSDDTQEWTLSASWKAHAVVVNDVCWAHPEFGEVLASCSYDRTVCIFEEEEPGKPWRKRATLVDARDNVVAIAFAPRHSGLRIATASHDGYVRVYEAVDIVSLAHWNLLSDFEADADGAMCISWNSTQFDAPMLAVGTKKPIVNIHVYNDVTRKWPVIASLSGHTLGINSIAWAPQCGRSFHLLATASDDCTVKIWRLQLSTTSGALGSSTRVGGATGGGNGSSKNDADDGNASKRWVARSVASFDDHKERVWRCAWNITGTTLATTGDDGCVRLWRATVQGAWRCMSVVSE